MDKAKQIEAPCRVGDILYRGYPLEEDITEWVVEKMAVTENGWGITLYRRDTGFHKTFPERDLWRWFWDSKEEAEAELQNNKK